jgi:hypothetical protein
MKSAFFLLALTVVLALPACSSRNWFEGVQATARQQCQQNPDRDAARRCEEESRQRKYEDYERERPK